MPFNNANEYYFLNKVVCDKFNNLHCQGYHRFSGQSHQQIMYFTYTNAWSDYSIINQGAAWAGSDMALENGLIPHIAWRQQTSNTMPANDGTSYSYLYNNNWTDPYLIVEDPSDQAIIVDKNNVVYIVDNEKTENGYQQVQYKRTVSNWIGEIIGVNSTGFYEHILLSSDTVLFLGYIEKKEDNTGFSIKLKRSSILLNIQQHDQKLELSVFPNPFCDKTQIRFETTLFADVQVKILNLEGKLINTLTNENKTPGRYSINWEGKDFNGKEVSPGLYLVRLQAGRHVVTRSVVKTK